jgi:DNA-binding transcriptional regulator LsrR (DeoR family)
MYYLDGRDQDDIAAVLGTSRSNVSRMLSAARRMGIVEIRVREPYGRDSALEQTLRREFELADVRVAAFRPGSDTHRAVGELAAQWLHASLRDRQILALSTGTTLQATVAATSFHESRMVEVVPLVGALCMSPSHVSGEELVRDMARRLGGTYRYLHAPAAFGSHATLEALLEEPSIMAVLDRAATADVAVVGLGRVGAGSSQQLLSALRLTSAELDAFRAREPVGDVCCRFYDTAGHAITGAVHDRVLAVTLDQLRRIPTVIGVAAGQEKAASVLGALNGRVINALVVDAGLAHAALAAAGPRHLRTSHSRPPPGWPAESQVGKS